MLLQPETKVHLALQVLGKTIVWATIGYQILKNCWMEMESWPSDWRPFEPILVPTDVSKRRPEHFIAVNSSLSYCTFHTKTHDIMPDALLLTHKFPTDKVEMVYVIINIGSILALNILHVLAVPTLLINITLVSFQSFPCCCHSVTHKDSHDTDTLLSWLLITRGWLQKAKLCRKTSKLNGIQRIRI